jgi:Domain of unknown function (DUF4878)
MIYRAVRNASLIAIVLMLAACGASPESTVESFYEAVADGEIEKAQGYISSQIVGMLGAQKLTAALSEESQRVQSCKGFKSIDVQLQGEGEVRSGTVVVTYNGDCPEKRENVQLLKEDGEWKIGVSK